MLQQIHICKEEHPQKMGEKTRNHKLTQAALKAQIKSRANGPNAYMT